MLGPHDQRGRITRCEACARRRIKCHGGIPCHYCTRMGKKCVPPVQKAKKTFFINQITEQSDNSLTVSVSSATPKLSPNISLLPSDQLLVYFFSTFLKVNNFTGGTSLDLETIVSSYQTSPSLHSAIVAVSALDIGKRSLDAALWTRSQVIAINAYQASLCALQVDLEKSLVLQKESSLWSTFFLGIFELMYDVSGEGWIKHILYGTSKMLQARGPNQHLSGPGRSFFLTVRVYEICRALIYVEPTFLATEGWKRMTRQIWTVSKSDWHPKEALFDLLIECASLMVRTHETIILCESLPLESCSSLFDEIAAEGCRIKGAMAQWHEQALQWQERSLSSPQTSNDFQMVLAIIYYHATRIFLSGTFDYFYQFDNITTPKLTMTEVQNDVSAILALTHLALKKTNLAGMLFFYPLRVAGARSRTNDQKRKILDMLTDISRRNFIVADAFSKDLSQLWTSRDNI